MGSVGGLNLDNVQGDILMSGLPKRAEIFFFFTIVDAQSFCTQLKKVADEISHTLHTTAARDDIANSGSGATVPVVGANIAFSFQGLQKVYDVHRLPCTFTRRALV